MSKRRRRRATDSRPAADERPRIPEPEPGTWPTDRPGDWHEDIRPDDWGKPFGPPEWGDDTKPDDWSG